MNRHSLFAAVLTLLVWPAAGGDTAPATRDLEAAWRAADGVDLDGEVIGLTAGEAPFVAIFRQHTTRDPVGAVVLVHDDGTSANSLEVIRPLRIGLSDAGWDTLSLQLPAARTTHDIADWMDNADAFDARLQAALGWLERRGPTPRVILALGASGQLAVRFAATADREAVRALVIVSTPTAPAGTADREALTGLQRPLLDIHAEHDVSTVRDGAQAREREARKAEPGTYRRHAVPGARAGFHGLEPQLLATIRAWLNAQVAGPGDR